jgi:benzoyl-CoA reductase/2-hydroxyglutaryl-CoA dehydratase subunit BcrC/BadD/HgdB
MIILGEKFCDPHLFEIPGVRNRVEKLGLSTMWLETELAFTGREQMETRLEAFIDILRGKEEKFKR